MNTFRTKGSLAIAHFTYQLVFSVTSETLMELLRYLQPGRCHLPSGTLISNRATFKVNHSLLSRFQDRNQQDVALGQQVALASIHYNDYKIKHRNDVMLIYTKRFQNSFAQISFLVSSRKYVTPKM
jgi:hypothetical protein